MIQHEGITAQRHNVRTITPPHYKKVGKAGQNCLEDDMKDCR